MHSHAKGQAAIFLDKDGTLTPDIPFNVDPELIELSPRAVEGLGMLSAAGFRLVVVSNQSGVARGYFQQTDLAVVERRIRELLASHGIVLDGFYHCPHHPAGIVPEFSVACDCRKPRPGLLKRAAADLNLAPGDSWMIGDILDDVEAGHAAGCRTVLLLNGGERQWHLNSARRPELLADNLEDAAAKILEWRDDTDVRHALDAAHAEGRHVGSL